MLVKANSLFMHDNQLNEPLPSELGDMENLRELRLQDNRIVGSIPEQIGKLSKLRTLDLYNNMMNGSVPATIKNLTNLKVLYLQNEMLAPVRQRYCRIRIPNVGKYNWRIMRDEYSHYTSVTCDNPYDVEFTFNSLQASGTYDATS